MQLYLIYLVLLLVVLLILYKGIELNVKYAPLKIKYLSIGILLAMTLRYITLVVMLAVKNIKYLYVLKSVYFINLIALPMAAFIILYILARNDKIKISFIFILLPLFLAAYTIMLYKLPCYIVLDANFGYNMYLDRQIIVFGLYIVINTLILFGSILLLDNKYANKPGLILVIVSALITIVEALLMLNGIKLLPSPIISDLIWMLALNYAISRLKK
ncbi:hypothetical protein [Clostridium omnivorum]|uniref:Histidine kinase N-terminal 7TM region domain-containing protein n=1 Tax=Clostridium omnivorum TaxID=1604902 RepID=A0ABQ5N251_9CLOT|nr:hypothetical protein [Clostridium sp. E14]GLC29241.1 hypothetical protein bsdE14_06510 [Clostridium sp. E14]